MPQQLKRRDPLIAVEPSRLPEEKIKVYGRVPPRRAYVSLGEKGLKLWIALSIRIARRSIDSEIAMTQMSAVIERGPLGGRTVFFCRKPVMKGYARQVVGIIVRVRVIGLRVHPISNGSIISTRTKKSSSSNVME